MNCIPTTAGERRPACFVVATPMTAQAFLVDILREVASQRPLVLITNTDDTEFMARVGVPCEIIPLDIHRAVSLPHDLRALWRLFRIFRQRRFALVHSVTPKAGLLAQLAGWMAGVPVRLHTFTGQVWAIRTGPWRWLLKSLDALMARCATRVLADGHSQRDFLVAEGVVAPGRIDVLAEGSISGVSLQRFHPDEATRARLRAELAIPDDAVAFLFLGRLNRDKGLFELAEAFVHLATQEPNAVLVVVGPDEEGIWNTLVERLGAVMPRVRRRDYTREPEIFMAMADCLVLPSYREGFGSVVIEAAACGIPAVATRIYGLTDAVVDGETGLLVPVRDAWALSEAMRLVVGEPGLRERLGGQALARAREAFSQQRLTQAWLDFHDRQEAAAMRSQT